MEAFRLDNSLAAAPSRRWFSPWAFGCSRMAFVPLGAGAPTRGSFASVGTKA